MRFQNSVAEGADKKTGENTGFLSEIKRNVKHVKGEKFLGSCEIYVHFFVFMFP